MCTKHGPCEELLSRLQRIEEEDIDPLTKKQKTTLLKRMLLTYKLTPMRKEGDGHYRRCID